MNISKEALYKPAIAVAIVDGIYPICAVHKLDEICKDYLAKIDRGYQLEVYNCFVDYADNTHQRP